MGLGSIIRSIRLEKNISIVNLCEGICTERYLYMIEGDKRYPSADIIRKLSVRLQHNIFDYMEYMDYTTPVKSKLMIENIIDARVRNDFEKLNAYIEQSNTHNDSKMDYFNNELINSQIALDLLYKNDIRNAENFIRISIRNRYSMELDEILKNENKIVNYDLLVKLNYYFIYLIKSDNIKYAGEIIDFLWNNIQHNRDGKYYEQFKVTISINYFEYKMNVLNDFSLINQLKAFLNFQYEKKIFDRIFFSYHFLLNYYFQKNLFDEAKVYGKKLLACQEIFSNDDRLSMLIKSNNYILIQLDL